MALYLELRVRHLCAYGLVGEVMHPGERAGDHDGTDHLSKALRDHGLSSRPTRGLLNLPGRQLVMPTAIVDARLVDDDQEFLRR